MRHGSRLLAPLVTGLAVLLAGTLPVGPAAAATVDTTGPVVDTVNYSPGTLDLDSDQRSVHVSIVVTDASGIELDDLGLARPSLDDVFLHLTGRRAEQGTDAESESTPEGATP